MEAMEIPKNLNGYKLFSALGIFFLGLEFLAILLAIARIFYWPILFPYILGGIGLLLLLFFRSYKKIMIRELISAALVTLVAISAIFFFSLSAEPSVFSGRDQGSFSEAAVRLAQNHQLDFETPASQEFFKIYGAGSALNFPGFNYTQEGRLVTHFSLGYTAWLAVFYSIFGLGGFSVANGILFFLFLLSFFSLLKIHAGLKSAWLGFLLALSTFVFSWFFKFTLSENLALGFIWFGILELFLWLKYRDRFFFFTALVTFLLLTFTRIEAWALLVMLGVVLFILSRKEKNLFSKNDRKLFEIIGGIFSLTFLTNLAVNSQFYRSSLKGLWRSFSPEENGLSAFESLLELFDIFAYYNILIFLLIGGLGILYFVSKKKYFLLTPFFLLLPIFIYLLHPGISPDHPWMLRRFTFAIIPLGIFYTVLVIDYLFKRKSFFFLTALLLFAANLPLFLPFSGFSENKNLLSQTKKLSENFSSTDLVLIDRLTSGDGWSMPSGPLSFLYGKQAVYFFNPKDLQKIDTQKFSNVYLIIPDESLALYEKSNLLENLVFQKNYQFTKNYLLIPDLKKTGGFSQVLPLKSQKTTNGKIYLLKQ